jgi:hypothetical protein
MIKLVIGIVLLIICVFIYLIITSKNREQFQAQDCPNKEDVETDDEFSRYVTCLKYNIDKINDEMESKKDTIQNEYTLKVTEINEAERAINEIPDSQSQFHMQADAALEAAKDAKNSCSDKLDEADINIQTIEANYSDAIEYLERQTSLPRDLSTYIKITRNTAGPVRLGYDCPEKCRDSRGRTRSRYVGRLEESPSRPADPTREEREERMGREVRPMIESNGWTRPPMDSRKCVLEYDAINNRIYLKSHPQAGRIGSEEPAETPYANNQNCIFKAEQNLKLINEYIEIDSPYDELLLKDNQITKMDTCRATYPVNLPVVGGSFGQGRFSCPSNVGVLKPSVTRPSDNPNAPTSPADTLRWTSNQGLNPSQFGRNVGGWRFYHQLSQGEIPPPITDFDYLEEKTYVKNVLDANTELESKLAEARAELATITDKLSEIKEAYRQTLTNSIELDQTRRNNSENGICNFDLLENFFKSSSDNNFKYVSGCCDDLINEGDGFMTELYKIDQDASNVLNVDIMQPKLFAYCNKGADSEPQVSIPALNKECSFYNTLTPDIITETNLNGYSMCVANKNCKLKDINEFKCVNICGNSESCNSPCEESSILDFKQNCRDIHNPNECINKSFTTSSGETHKMCNWKSDENKCDQICNYIINQNKCDKNPLCHYNSTCENKTCESSPNQIDSNIRNDVCEEKRECSMSGEDNCSQHDTQSSCEALNYCQYIQQTKPICTEKVG